MRTAQFCAHRRLTGNRQIRNWSVVGGNGNTFKKKRMENLKIHKQTSIASVPDFYPPAAIFPTPLISHCTLPLITPLDNPQKCGKY
jgi:hypothetical protein